MKWSVSLRGRVGTLELDVELDGDARPIVLVGPNGAGKTTLLRMIAGARRANEGHIAIGPSVLVDSKRGIELPPEQRGIGYVPQGYGLFPHLRAVDNVAFGLACRGVDKPARRQRAAQLLERLGCSQLAGRLPRGLSGGERQKIALARALIVEPDLLLLDEPLSALDATSRRVMRAFLVEHLAKREKPAIVVTHDLRDVFALGSEVVVLEGGKILQRGSPGDLSAAPASPFVEELFDVPLAAGA